MKKIAINYLTGWFIIDFIACLPTQFIEKAFSGDDGGDTDGAQVKMVRLARLPRLYRMVRMLRMLKMLRVFRKQSSFKEWMSTMNISVGMVRMLNVLVL